MDFGKFWGGAAAPYEIEQSLRFDGTQYLERTFSTAGNRRSWTWSVWAKIADPNPTKHMNLSTCEFTNRTYYDIFAVNQNSSEIAWSASTTSGTPYGFNSNDKMRDPSAWYHFVYVWDSANATADDRCVIYVNGVRASKRSGSNPTQNTDSLGIGQANKRWRIGADIMYDSQWRMRGYMAEVVFVDGQSLDPTDLGEFDSNGVWRPINPSGLTFGSNGYYLKFDPSATNGIGHDHSGNGNNFTPTAGFVTSGTGTDVFSDTPTTNYATWNPVEESDTWNAYGVGMSNGNLQYGTNNYWNTFTSTIAFSSGKWYYELEVTGNSQAGIVASDWTGTPGVALQTGGALGYNRNDGKVWEDSVGTSYGNTFTGSHTLGIAVDADNDKFYFAIDNTWQNSANPSSGTGGYSITMGSKPWRFAASAYSCTGQIANFGQRAFQYTPPTGFNALNTANLPAPDIANGSDYFDIALDTGANIRSTAQSTFSNGLWWIKDRANSNQHQFVDSQRGTTTAWTQPESVPQKTYVAPSGNSVAWSWSAPDSWSNSAGTNGATIASSGYRNQSAGFSIAQFTGQRPTTVRVAHGLNTTPDFIITRYLLGTSYSALVYHKDTGTQYGSWFDYTYGGSGSADYVTVNSQYIEHGNSAALNETGTNGMIMYCWSAIPGYSAFGKYKGNSSTDGPFIYTGFKPRWIMTRGLYTSGAPSDYNWRILDTERDPYNGAWNMLWANKTDYEAQSVTSSNAIDILSNGFKIRTNSVEVNNSSGPDYIWAAWAENPFGGDGVSPATAR